MRFQLIRQSVPLFPVRGPTKLLHPRGMTLLEVTVVILVLLSLITILFIGARGWKRGSDRALCIVNIQNIQKGVRGYSNLYDISPGASVPGLRSKVIGMGRFVESVPTCAAGGVYSFGLTTGGEDTVPQVGELYMECDRAGVDEHVPTEYSDW
jgi:prepilin-type N-terminal cleavage/methylation domain-containing protein